MRYRVTNHRRRVRLANSLAVLIPLVVAMAAFCTTSPDLLQTRRNVDVPTVWKLDQNSHSEFWPLLVCRNRELMIRFCSVDNAAFLNAWLWHFASSDALRLFMVLAVTGSFPPDGIHLSLNTEDGGGAEQGKLVSLRSTAVLLDRYGDGVPAAAAGANSDDRTWRAGGGVGGGGGGGASQLRLPRRERGHRLLLRPSRSPHPHARHCRGFSKSSTPSSNSTFPRGRSTGDLK